MPMTTPTTPPVGPPPINVTVKWLNPRLLQIMLPDRTLDLIWLTSTGRVPCLFSGKMESDPSSFAVVSGCISEKVSMDKRVTLIPLIIIIIAIINITIIII